MVDNNLLHRSSFPSIVKQWILLMSNNTNPPSNDPTSEHHPQSLFETTYFSFPDYEALQQPDNLEKSSKSCHQEHNSRSSAHSYMKSSFEL
ncbi:unnamed protein product [Cunninghamella echinulata]